LSQREITKKGFGELTADGTGPCVLEVVSQALAGSHVQGSQSGEGDGAEGESRKLDQGRKISFGLSPPCSISEDSHGKVSGGSVGAVGQAESRDSDEAKRDA